MLDPFLGGAISMGFLVAGLFFLRFWRTTRDRLFLFFAAAFFILMAERVVRGAMEIRTEWVPYVYMIRLAAFVLILIAILDKNRRA
jgi:membrane-associated PAP2 superfamily phosphatase